LRLGTGWGRGWTTAHRPMHRAVRTILCRRFDGSRRRGACHCRRRSGRLLDHRRRGRACRRRRVDGGRSARRRRWNEVARAPPKAERHEQAGGPGCPLPHPLALEHPRSRPPANFGDRRSGRSPGCQPGEHRRSPIAERRNLVAGCTARRTVGEMALDLDAAQTP
jgi:hypothetical protein